MKALFDMIHEGPHKLMLFGAACTQVTDPIAKASKHWRLTQVSYEKHLKNLRNGEEMFRSSKLLRL